MGILFTVGVFFVLAPWSSLAYDVARARRQKISMNVNVAAHAASAVVGVICMSIAFARVA
jgi:hypothetical protein